MTGLENLIKTVNWGQYFYMEICAYFYGCKTFLTNSISLIITTLYRAEFFYRVILIGRLENCGASDRLLEKLVKEVHRKTTVRSS